MDQTPDPAPQPEKQSPQATPAPPEIQAGMEQTEYYKVTMQVGQQAQAFDFNCPNDMSVVMACAFIGAASYPNVVAMTIEHKATGRLVAFCPFMGILSHVAPKLNALGAQGLVVPAARVAPTGKGTDLVTMLDQARKAKGGG